MNKKTFKLTEDIVAGSLYHPGKLIAEQLEDNNMKQVELAEKLGIAKSEMSMIIHGKRDISVPLALNLEKIFGFPAEEWMNLQMKYEIGVVKQRVHDEMEAARSKKKKLKSHSLVRA